MSNFDFIWTDLMDPKKLSGKLFYGVIIATAAWLVGRAVSLAIHRYLDRAQAAGADATGIRFLGQLAKLAVYILAFVCYAHIVPGLQKLGTAWLASVGVVSVVVGLAAQSTLGNLIAGISLVLYRPFKIGDRVQVTRSDRRWKSGVVESIDLGYTLLRTADQPLPGHSQQQQWPARPASIFRSARCSRALRRFPLLWPPAATSTRRGRFFSKWPRRTQNRAGGWLLRHRRDQPGTVLTLAASCADAGAAPRMKSDLLENAKKQFDAAGIRDRMMRRWQRDLPIMSAKILLLAGTKKGLFLFTSADRRDWSRHRPVSTGTRDQSCRL